MDTGNESLKRVLQKIKGVARGWRKDNLSSRLSPTEDKPMGEKPVEEAEKVTVLEGPGDEGEEPGTEEETDEAKLAMEIKKLLARV